jgi:hypothetical protein
MMLTKQLQPAGKITLIGAKRRPHIMNGCSGQPANQPIRSGGRPTTDHPFAPLGAPAADHVVSILDLCEKLRDVFREMLEVCVHRDNDGAACLLESGLQGSRLSIVAA